MVKWPLLERGDTVLVHSSLTRLLHTYRGMTPLDVLESLLDAVGERGTLVLPLFNFDFCHGVPFDERTTPSHMGALTEAARVFVGAVRSRNPIYRFAAIGTAQNLFAVDNYESLGIGSPFHTLRSLDAKIAVIDLPDQKSMTLIHHVEEMHRAPNRFSKLFTAPYTDRNDGTTPRTYECRVRYENVETYVTPMERILWNEGVYAMDQFMRVGRARRIYDEVAKVIDRGSEGILWLKHPPEPGMLDVLP